MTRMKEEKCVCVCVCVERENFWRRCSRARALAKGSRCDVMWWRRYYSKDNGLCCLSGRPFVCFCWRIRTTTTTPTNYQCITDKLTRSSKSTNVLEWSQDLPICQTRLPKLREIEWQNRKVQSSLAVPRHDRSFGRKRMPRRSRLSSMSAGQAWSSSWDQNESFRSSHRKRRRPNKSEGAVNYNSGESFCLLFFVKQFEDNCSLKITPINQIPLLPLPFPSPLVINLVQESRMNVDMITWRSISQSFDRLPRWEAAKMPKNNSKCLSNTQRSTPSRTCGEP